MVLITGLILCVHSIREIAPFQGQSPELLVTSVGSEFLIWKQPICLSTDKQSVDIHIVECYSSLKRKEIFTQGHDAIWMNLDDIMLSKISQSQKDRLCDCTHMKYPEESNSQRLARN